MPTNTIDACISNTFFRCYYYNMEEGGNLNNIIAVAQREYLGQLNDVLLPFLIATFDEIYNRALVDSKGKKTLIKFQEYLRDIKSWNQGMVKRHADEICKSCAYFGDLLAAVFVSYVKILSSVRLKTEKQKISIKLPKNEDFIFRIYEENAKTLYKNPHWIAENPSDDEKIDKLREMNAVSLDVVIKSMVPVQEILAAYIGQGNSTGVDDTEVESQMGDPSDTEDPDIEDPHSDPGEEEEEVPVPPPPDTEEHTGDPENSSTLDDIETKNITVPRPPSIPEPENDDEGVLFPNATETRN